MIPPLPPPFTFNIVRALSGQMSRRPSNAPAAAHWLLNPTYPRISYNEREDAIRGLLEYFYGSFPPELVAVWRAEAAGLPPLDALRLFGSHLDDWIPH